MIVAKESGHLLALDEPKPFQLVKPRSIEEALAQFVDERETAYLAGGCDLLDQMKSQWHNPRKVIDLKGIDTLRERTSSNGFLRLGALTTLTALERDASIRERYRALSQAASRVATPQIRNLGTLGGNLLQDGRCPYYRGPWRCYRAGGIVCDAHHGYNAEHAIYGGHRCYIASPSDTATALVALGARVVVAGRQGMEEWPIERLHLLPQEDVLHMHRLHDGRLLTEVRLPETGASRSLFLKATMRNVWEFALVSIAVAHVQADHPQRGWRVVLGGVAPAPWRLPAVERLLGEGALTPALIGEAARKAVDDAEPLRFNGYKVALVQKLVQDALTEVAQ